MPILAVLGALAQFAPVVAKYFGKGDTVGTMIASVAKAVTGRETPEEAIAAMQQSQELQEKFKLAMLESETHLQEIYLADVQSARDRDVELAKAGNSNRRANILAGLAVLLVMFCMADAVWDSNINDYAKGVITLILGRALGWVEQIFSFEFGTTRSSRSKDDTISKLSGS